MKYEVYKDIDVTDDFEIFDFVSKGKNRNVLKRVAFSKTEQAEVYNLAFGDVGENGEDMIIKAFVIQRKKA